jgi:hypothetical protein
LTSAKLEAAKAKQAAEREEQQAAAAAAAAVAAESAPAAAASTVRGNAFSSRLCTSKTIDLPRRARDKHTKN